MTKKFPFFLALAFSAILLAPTEYANGQTWNVDRAHSSVGFKVKHFFTPVAGKFKEYDATVVFDPANLDGSSIDVTIQVASVDTDNDRRNGHLQSADFFDSANYPVITFKSDRIVAKGDNEFVAHGKLKIRDVEKDVELPFTLLGTMVRGERTIASFTANMAINRNDYGVGSGDWLATTVVADEVQVEIAIEANQR